MNQNRAVVIEVGLKVSVRDHVLSNIKNNPYIMQNFKLNIKRINRWWFSIYFAEICSHNAEKLIIDNVAFCSKCREKI